MTGTTKGRYKDATLRLRPHTRKTPNRKGAYRTDTPLTPYVHCISCPTDGSAVAHKHCFLLLCGHVLIDSDTYHETAFLRFGNLAAVDGVIVHAQYFLGSGAIVNRLYGCDGRRIGVVLYVDGLYKLEQHVLIHRDTAASGVVLSHPYSHRIKSQPAVLEVDDGVNLTHVVGIRIRHTGGHVGSFVVFATGENAVCAATSDNLTDWTPVLNENNELREIAKPRSGYFDSRLTECGPPAIKTVNGIVLLYNGKNGYKEERDSAYPAGAYCAGQFLFDANDPYKVLDRLDKPFFVPEAAFEKSGQYKDGTVFIEGLAYFKNKLYLYYGCADSQVAVAICDDNIDSKLKTHN